MCNILFFKVVDILFSAGLDRMFILRFWRHGVAFWNKSKSKMAVLALVGRNIGDFLTIAACEVTIGVANVLLWVLYRSVVSF